MREYGAEKEYREVNKGERVGVEKLQKARECEEVEPANRAQGPAPGGRMTKK